MNEADFITHSKGTQKREHNQRSQFLLLYYVLVNRFGTPLCACCGHRAPMLHTCMWITHKICGGKFGNAFHGYDVCVRAIEAIATVKTGITTMRVQLKTEKKTSTEREAHFYVHVKYTIRRVTSTHKLQFCSTRLQSNTCAVMKILPLLLSPIQRNVCKRFHSNCFQLYAAPLSTVIVNRIYNSWLLVDKPHRMCLSWWESSLFIN